MKLIVKVIIKVVKGTSELISNKTFYNTPKAI
ncbi:hypothetical protein HNP63_001276, partial [Borreliella afzelii]|nr:hypothetical protein [Borreliella afzelii]